MQKLSPGTVALVTGASRGIGKGVALALADAGATVYITGRTVSARAEGLPGSLDETVAAAAARSGRVIPLVCDHADDDQVSAVFARISHDAGRLDILVNNVFALPAGPIFGVPFWEQPLEVWDLMHTVGLRSHYVAARHAAQLMVPTKRGFIANISSFGARSYQVNVAYGVGKAAVDRLSADMAKELKRHGVTSVSLWPGIVRTERILASADTLPWDMSVTESPQFTGRAIVALANDPDLLERSGKTWVVAHLARVYGFTDTNGTQPEPLGTSGSEP